MRIEYSSGVLGSVATLVVSVLVSGCDGIANPPDDNVALDELHGAGDSLYIGDVADDTVKRVDTKTGVVTTFVTSESGGLSGPRGLIFGGCKELLVASQNPGADGAGEVLAYDARSGSFRSALVPHADSNAPFLPRGIVRHGGHLYVADMGDPDHVLMGGPPPNPFPARVARYDERTGAWDGDLDYPGFAQTCTGNVCVQWSPRALVLGPDGALYVSAMKFTSSSTDTPNTLRGRVLRFPDGGQGKGEVFVDGDTCNCELARPEGLTFGPDGRLYVTSFRTSETETDKILIFNGDGCYEDRIDLDQVGGPRAFAQAIVFGPKGALYVPISGPGQPNPGPETGSVRRYDVSDKTYDVVVPAGGALLEPWYLIFRGTAPDTLAYEP